jgi:hypothetical protein
MFLKCFPALYFINLAKIWPHIFPALPNLFWPLLCFAHDYLFIITIVVLPRGRNLGHITQKWLKKLA